MLNSEFTFAFEDFSGLESQIQFHAPLNSVSEAFGDGYIKWNINGLGEAYGFWFKLKSNQQPFIVKTFVDVNGSDQTEPIEWLIDTKSIELAHEVLKGLNLDSKIVTWEKKN
tara:strand:- start:356 stop:691 length:336 start_codon:yes stop_codon:yes gene_type:complete